MAGVFRKIRRGGSLLAVLSILFVQDNAMAAALIPSTPANPAPTGQSWPGGFDNSRITLARIQSDMERVAVGKPRWALPAGRQADAMERIVDAYAAFLHDDIKGMDAALADINGTTGKRLAHWQASMAHGSTTSPPPQAEYFDALTKAAASPLALQRLVAGLRRVDALLILELAEDYSDINLSSRLMPVLTPYYYNPINESWLRLPCRTIIQRSAAFAQVASGMKDLAGPLLSCPSRETAFDRLEAQARQPDGFVPYRLFTPPETKPAAPLPPTKVDEQHAAREQAMITLPGSPATSWPILKKAAEQGTDGRLDYALALHAFRPVSATGTAEIAALLAPLLDQARAGDQDNEQLDPYDGSDASLVPFLRQVSVQGIAGAYTIPCAALLARPALLEATRSYYGSRKDDALPNSGCASGPGEITVFPDMIVEDYIRATTKADGNFIDTMQGSAVFGALKRQSWQIDRLRVDPRGLLTSDRPAMAYPYQTWAMTGITAYQTSQTIRRLYQKAHQALTAYALRHGLSQQEAEEAAKIGLFNLAYGATCGEAVPRQSIRALLLHKAPMASIKAALALPDQGEAPEVLACGATAPLDPLLHVAVGHPAALAALLAQGGNVEQGNSFGKTPLMVAAQLDQQDSLRLLLQRHAQVNAITDEPLDPSDFAPLHIGHDARTPLMYAATSGSLTTIKRLLEAGADPYQADTKGYRAVDYLLGYGPTTSGNRTLTAAERKEAVRLLF
ncbi:Ankyrin repeat [Insolitispirillum peregrinum]|uniref:Ankyrin repeat n=2 Tax=Insolitispirillum peregrinum TaxID=80876 RepID=A0A1N7IIA6_9PROT|nr:Ankyrin repeat [Insolitispirillum peregrinum]